MRLAPCRTAAALAATCALAAAAEPSVAINGWTNVPNVREGTLTARPIDTTAPTPPYGYVEYLPMGYTVADPETGEVAVDTTKKWPVVIALLGTGEAGDGKNANGQLMSKMVKHGPLYQVNSKNWDFPAIVIGPQPFSGQMWNSANTLKVLIDYLKANYQADPDRIYMTGLCEGGGGTWRYAYYHPTTLAAIMPIQSNTSPWVDTSNPANYAHMAQLKIWAFHCFIDKGYPRRGSLFWMDPIAKAAYPGFASNLMSSYPGYGDIAFHKMNHYPIVDVDANGLPDAYKNVASYSASLTVGSKNVTWSSNDPISFGVDWNSTESKPFARLAINGRADTYVVSSYLVGGNGKIGGVVLTQPFIGPDNLAGHSVSVQIPNTGINMTGDIVLNGGGAATGWAWGEGVLRNDAGRLRQTLYYYNSHGQGWKETWENGDTWDWLFSQAR